MSVQNQNPVIENVRRALGRRAGDPCPPRPPVLPARPAMALEAEIDLLLKEINSLSGHAQRLPAGELPAALSSLVSAEEVRQATLWPASEIADLQVEAQLRSLGVQVVPAHSDLATLAQCDLGVTGVDFALPETGTLGLLSSPDKPRWTSLLPRVHLAILRPTALCADLHTVFEAAKNNAYLVFITGPSRTADIELTVTLGVHGPKSLYVWVLM